MHLRFQHLIAAAVALAAFGAGLNQGGYALGFVAGAAIAIWWVVLFGLLLRLLPRQAPPVAAVAAGGSLALLAAWTAASLGWASDDGAAFVEIVRVLSYLGLFALVVLASGREGPRPWLTGLTLGLTGIVVLGLASRFEPSFGNGDLTGARLSYPLGYWNAYGACAATSLLLLAWHAANAERPLSRSLATAILPLPALAIFLSGSRGGVAAALIGAGLLLALGPRRLTLSSSLALAALAAAPLIVFANSREALLDGLTGSGAASEGHQLLLLALALCAAAAAARHRLDGTLMAARLRPPVRNLAIAAGALVLLAVVVSQDPLDRLDRFKEPPAPAEAGGGGSNFTNDNGSGRYQFWDAALEALGEEPLRGVGAGQYEAWWNQNGSIHWVLRDAHSLLFETAAELGLVGLALLAAFLTIVAAAGWRRRLGEQGAAGAACLALLGAGVFSASIDWMWELPAVFAPVVLAAALLSGPATAAGAAPGSIAGAREVPQRRRLALGVATALIAWLALLCAADLLVTRVKLEESRSAAAAGDFGASAEAANDAIALQPWAAEPRVQLGLVQEGSGDVAAAASTLRGATERAPEDWRIWFLLGRVEARANHPAASRAALERAERLNPRSPDLNGDPEGP